MESLADVVLYLAAILLIAGTGHWSLRRLRRRVPRILRRRFGRAGPVALSVEIATSALSLVLWVSAAAYASEHFALLARARETVVRLIAMSLSATLFTVGEQAFALRDLMLIPLLLGAIWLAVSFALALLRQAVLQPSGIGRGVQETISSLSRHAAMLVATIVVLQAWGIDVRNLALLASVLGVGIGFGLQNLANNFVSGIALNLERPIQPGDFVQLGDLSGTVERIGGRCTEIRTLDRVTILVPNSKLLESEVVNWSHGDSTCRLHLKVGVAYSTDLRRLRSVLLEVAQQHPAVRNEPRPRVEVHGFGESAIECELLVWIDEPRAQNEIKSELNFTILARLRQHGIEIPFPQSVIHVSRARHTPPAPLTSGSEIVLNETSGPRRWPDERLHQCAARMRQEGGVSIVDRRHLLRVYTRCFVGREAVDWLIHNEGLTRSEAIELGELLVERDIIHHVLDEHGFKDGNFFYRFYADESALAA